MTFLKKLITLIFAFILIDFLVSTVLFEVSNASKIRYSRLYTEKINADIVFICNSRGINSFYQPYFDTIPGLKSINLSYNGLTIPLVKVLLEDYFQRNNPPKIIFLEITCLDVNYDTLPIFKQYMTYSPSINNMIKKHNPKIYNVSSFSKSFMFNSEYFFRTLYYLWGNDQTWINRYTISKDYYESLEPGNLYELINKVDNNALKIFKTMVEEYREKGVIIIPVLAPIIDKVRNKIVINKYLADIRSYFKIDIFDLSDAINDIHMFCDAIHTNDKGARILANKLLNLPEMKNLTITH